MRMNAPQKIVSISLLLLVLIWVALYLSHITEGFYNYLYSFLFGLIPLIGGFFAMMCSEKWGRFTTAIGKAVFFIGLGLFLWGCGETIWSYYNFFAGIAAPYPSLADIGFAPSIFFYGIGALYLSKATGAKFGFRKTSAKILTVLGSIILLAISYYLLVVVARGGVIVPEGESTLKTILDVAYPIGDFVALILAALISGLSFKYMGGKYVTSTVAILLGLLVMFIGDVVFSYTIAVNTYYNADFGDLILTFGLFLLTFGVLGFHDPRKH
ncbi:MAG: hypothetical protein ABIP54_02870 [Candidatus Andersenbacteria bacterium]